MLLSIRRNVQDATVYGWRNRLCLRNRPRRVSKSRRKPRWQAGRKDVSLFEFSQALLHHFAHGRGRTRRAPLAPGLQALAGFLNSSEKLLIPERRPPGGHDGAHAVPDHPDFAVALEE